MSFRWQKTAGPRATLWVKPGDAVIPELGTTTNLVSATPQIFAEFAAFSISDTNPVVLSVGTNVS